MEISGISALWRDKRLRGLVMVILASILEKADMAAGPSVFREIGIELHASPSKLGSITLVRSLTQALCSPMAGYLTQRYRRPRVIVAGTFISAIATFSVGCSTTFAQIAISMGVSSLGVALTWPAILSSIADATNDSNRGTVFGWLMLTGHVGAFFGGFVAVVLAGTSVAGISGWRVAFFILSALSLLITSLLYLFADDLSAPPTANPTKRTFAEELWEACRLLRVKSVQILMLVTIVRDFGWSNFSFLPMWLELVGFTHATTATLIALFIGAGSIGGLLGGWLGDISAEISPNTGRILVAQLSTGLALPFTALVFLALPVNPSATALYGICTSAMGFVISWNIPSTNGPIMAEVVSQPSRTNVYGLERMFSSLAAAFGPPLTGLLSEREFGYHMTNGTSDRSTERHNASALGKAIFCVMGIPFFLCSLIYIWLHQSYPRDRDRVLGEQYILEQTSGLDQGHDQEELQFSSKGAHGILGFDSIDLGKPSSKVMSM